jgi:hypothetical protein
MRSKSQYISHGVPETAKHGVPELGESIVTNNIVSEKIGVLNNISYISSNRPGPPSWVVRCLETGLIFTSQAKACVEMDITPSDMSKHLNGVQDTARGFHFERICMAA